jgi:hypothetical protein
MRTLLLSLLLAFLAGCAVTPTLQPVSSDDANWLRELWNQELPEFTLPAATAPMAWKRGQSYIARYSGGIVYAYAFAIRSHPGGTDGQLIVPGFNVSRIVAEDGSATFYVQTYGPDGRQAKLQAMLLARYMRTGELREQLINRLVPLGQILNP